MPMTIHHESVVLFLSYAHEDEALLRILEVHLSLLKRQSLISTWYDRQIVPGTDWAETISTHLEQASIILLLVSPDFLASDYCYDVEMRRALKRHESKEARVIPIILRPCGWNHAPFAHLSCLPQDGKPITTWDNQDIAWNDVETGICRAIDSLFSLTANVSLYTTPTEERKAVEEEKHQKEEVATVHRRRASFSAPFPEVWNVHRRHTPFFTGRDHVLQQLADGFLLESGVEMVQHQAITGLGGMGKTQTAAEYVYLFRADYKAVFWVHAETQETLIADFKTIADLLELPQERLQDRTSLIQTVQGWLKKQADWLLVFDNADDPALVDPFLPSATRGHVLLTTRAGAMIGQAQQLVLESLKPEDGALCILRRAGILKGSKQLHDTLPANVEAAQELSQKMGGLPMALEQAGAYINDTACGVKGYLYLYERYRPRLYQHHSGTVPDYPEAVAFAWRISRSIVERSDPAASELLCLCAYLAPEGIPEKLLMLGAPVLGPVAGDLFALNLTIRLLRTYSLLNREFDRDTELTRLSIHRIMQDILIDEMDEPTRQLWAERAVRAVSLALPAIGDNLPQAQVQNCLQLIEQWHMSFPEVDVIRKYAEKVM